MTDYATTARPWSAQPEQFRWPSASWSPFGRLPLSGVGGVAGLAAQLIVSPTPTAPPEFDELPRWYTDSRYISPSFRDLDFTPGGFDVVLPGEDAVITPDLVYASGLDGLTRDQSPPLPDMPGLRETHRHRNLVNEHDMTRLNALFPSAPRDLLDIMPSTVMPRQWVRGTQQVDLLRTLSIYKDRSDMRLKVDTRSVDPQFNSVARQKDQKMGRAGYRAILRVINKTLGTASEVGDFVDTLKVNTWVQLPSGNIVSLAGSELPTARWAQLLWTGQARVDTVGFAIDFAFQQATDVAYAIGGAPFEFARSHSPVWGPDSFGGQRQLYKEAQSVLTSPLVQSLQSLQSRSDPARRKRVLSLFS